MKNLTFLFVFLLSFIPLSIHSQKDTIWFDSNWNNSKKEQAVYYRISPESKNSGFIIIDYFLSGAKQMEAFSLTPDEKSFDGKVIWYYENGNTLQTVNYKNGVLNGNRKNYYENGSLKSEYSYLEGEIEGKWKELFENGNTKETGAYEKGQKEGHWKSYYTNGKLKKEGEYVFDRKVDVWKTNYYDGTIEN